MVWRPRLGTPGLMAASPHARDFGNHVPECCDSEAPAWGGVKEGLCGGLPSFPGLQDSAVFLWGVG